MRAPKAASGLTLVNASAGSGKTYRLTEEVVCAVGSETAEHVELEGLLAVTYTRKAAAELGARIRHALVESRRTDDAQRLPLAYIGTVHAVCLRLIQENALDAGLSPEVDVVPGDELRLLRQALEWGIEPELRRRAHELAYRLQLRWDARTDRTDWITPVADIMTLARGNRIDPAALPLMAERSAKRLLELLGPVEEDGPALDLALLEALRSSVEGLTELGEDSGVGQETLQSLRDALRKSEHGQLTWADWVRLQKTNHAGRRGPIVAPVIAAASRVDSHPRLHQELRELTLTLYEVARKGLEAYQAWKAQRRVVDFVDMIDRALTLLDTPEVADELRQRLDLSVVDEVQDTSPVQLALFLKLHLLAGRSSWVGDPKQCIFEFTGADPGLMQAVTDWVADNGGRIERLGTNYRSRPELVEACSRLFSEAFAAQGFTAEDVIVAPHRTLSVAPSVPPFGLWALTADNQAEAAEALAEGVLHMLAAPSETRVVDRSSGEPRDLRPGDVAVLTATNAEAEAVAAALARRGIRAAIARAGLLSTPEGSFVEAALRRVLDAQDRLAEAELEALSGFDGKDPDAWLRARLLDAEPSASAARRVEIIDELRAIADSLSPSEILDRVLGDLDVIALTARWPDPHQRTANLEALRALALGYEQRCRQEREPATLAGMLRYFAESAEKAFIRDEELASDDQHVSEGEHAVTLVTYHRAKGLEWPVVVLASLDKREKRDAFDVSPESDRRELDAEDPLGGRWIRYWPWPFGQQQKCGLAERVAASPEGQAVAERERRERVRLLYVGFTRARDHLVLAVRRGKKGLFTHWLDELADSEGRLLLSLPHPDANGGAGEIAFAGGAWPIRCWGLDTGGESPARIGEGERHVIFRRPTEPRRAHAAFRIAPSRATSEWPELPTFDALEDERYGGRIPLGDSKDVSWDEVGDTLHAFLAADVPGMSTDIRRQRAERLLAGADLRRLLLPDALLKASDELRAWVGRRWPDARWHREIPITANVMTADGRRRVVGVIDLLLDTPAGAVVIDYKSFPGAASGWRQRAAELAPQLAAYARALEIAGSRVSETWLCFPVGGGAVRVG
jgi:ATP-dependent helicase/nuclease subunit A